MQLEIKETKNTVITTSHRAARMDAVFSFSINIHPPLRILCIMSFTIKTKPIAKAVRTIPSLISLRDRLIDWSRFYDPKIAGLVPLDILGRQLAPAVITEATAPRV